MDNTIKRTDYAWLSLHIYFSGDADEFLKRAVAPFIGRWKSYFSPGSPWFFIRYWEGGNHIRLRFHGNPFYHEQIKSSLNNDIFNYPNALYKVEKVLTAHYDPEISRYGNEESIAWAEGHFAASSSYILNWLLTIADNRQVTLQAIQLHLMLLFCAKLEPGKMIKLCDFFINGWLPKLYRPEIPVEHEKEYWLNHFEHTFSSKKDTICLAANHFWEELAENKLNNNLTEYSARSQEIMNQYQQAEFNELKVQEIISSLIHMTNNRLGIANQEEAYLMYVVKTCIQSIYQAYYSN
jgi:thiopeptide-type bacteriocin biosynthesis protein